MGYSPAIHSICRASDKQPTLSGLLKDPGAEHEEVGIFESLSFAFFILHDVLDGSEGLLLVHTV